MERQRRAGGGVDQLPSGRYRVRIATSDGRRVSLGTFSTKRAAEATYARSLTEQADGKVVAPRQRGTTLGTYAPRWVESRLTSKGEPLRPRVRELYDKQLEHHILPTLGDVALDRLDTATVRRWVTQVRGPSGPGVSTAAKCYRLLRSIMATAVEDGLALTNPCTIKGAGTEPKPETDIPTVAEVHKLADCIDERLRCVVLLAAFMGLRKGELLGLRRGDVDLDAQVLTVREQRQTAWSGQQLVGPPKTDAGRRSIAIPSALVAELQHHVDGYSQPSDDAYFFTGFKGGRLSPAVWTTKWTEARQQVGVEHIRLHDLRHLAGTLAASTGAGTKELMHRLGHASPRAALIYQHATRERDVAIAEAMNEHIDSRALEPKEKERGTNGST